MATYYPVFITIALFIAIVLDDLLVRSPESITKHSLEGLVSTLLMVVLSYNNMEFVSWGLLILPLIVLIAAYHFASLQGTPALPACSGPPPIMSSPIQASGSASTISVPASPTVSARADAKAPPIFTPITSCGT